MFIYVVALLILAAKTRSVYSKHTEEIAGISVSDDVSVSAGSNGVKGQFDKSINVKPPLGLLNIFGLGGKSSGSKSIGFNVGGGIGLKPKLSDDGTFGISLGGSGGVGFGISDSSDKGYSGKGYYETSDRFNGIGNSEAIDHVVGTDLSTSIGKGGISAGGVSADEYSSGSEDNNWNGGKSTTRSVGQVSANVGKDIAISHGKGYESRSEYVKGGIVISHEGHESDRSRLRGHEGSSKGGEAKNGKNGSNHVEGGSIISHDNTGLEFNSDYEYNRNGNGRIKGEGGTVISYEGHESDYNGHWSSSKRNSGRVAGRVSEQQGGTDDGRADEGEKHVTVSYRNDGESRDGTIGTEINSNNSSHPSGGGDAGSIIDHEKGGRDKVTGSESGNSAGHGGVGITIGGKGIFDNGKCGSNVEETLQFVRLFIHAWDAVVHFLLELEDTDLRNILCHISSDSNLSCQLDCGGPTMEPFFYI